MLIVLFWIGLAGVPTNIGRWGKAFVFFVHYINLEIFRLGISVVGLLILFVFFLLPYLKPKMQIELIPSAGASSEVMLRVLNHGNKREFQAQCTPIALRNSPNELRRGTFDLKWEHTFDRIVSIGNNASCNLVIARVQNEHRNGFSEMEIV
ncbi:MAG TPA: hypothetical protein VG272_08780, partial [Candidatus Acidoferrales bacterium]|nr:hypothetical protein [Candidatus Acidoferrales bacterium]